MIKTICFTGLFNISIQAEVEIKILDNLILTNKKTSIPQILIPAQIKNVIGINEIESIIANELIFISKDSLFFKETTFNENSFLKKFLVLTELFCQALWLVKDNSANTEMGHLIFENEGNIGVHSNFWNSKYCNSIGNLDKTHFNNEEIKKAIFFLPLIFSIHYIDLNLINETVKMSSKVSPLLRGFFFLHSARNSEDIGTKISHYCSAFESIFSVSTSELKHRLSETIAFFLAEIQEERLKIYKNVQQAYDIRSAVVHGDGIPNKFLKNDFELLFSTAKSIDEILRKSITKILTHSELTELFTIKTKEDISNYLQYLIFSK